MFRPCCGYEGRSLHNQRCQYYESMQLGLVKPDIQIDTSVEFLPKGQNAFSEENANENFDIDDQSGVYNNVYREVPQSSPTNSAPKTIVHNF